MTPEQEAIIAKASPEMQKIMRELDKEMASTDGLSKINALSSTTLMALFMLNPKEDERDLAEIQLDAGLDLIGCTIDYAVIETLTKILKELKDPNIEFRIVSTIMELIETARERRRHMVNKLEMLRSEHAKRRQT